VGAWGDGKIEKAALREFAEGSRQEKKSCVEPSCDDALQDEMF
jgi:hypothetical protein